MIQDYGIYLLFLDKSFLSLPHPLLKAFSQCLNETQQASQVREDEKWVKKKNILSYNLIIRMIVVLKITVISRSDQRFDNLSRIRHQNKERGCLSVERHNSGSWTMIDELCRDVVGCETRAFIAGKKSNVPNCQIKNGTYEHNFQK